MRSTLAAISVALAAWLLWVAAATHLDRACVLMDTPYLPLCPTPETVTPEAGRAELRERLARNPGDSSAWINLTNLETGATEQALLRAAIALAPNDPNVQMWRAGQALTQNQLAQAAELLVQIVQYRGGAEPAQALARLVASGEGTELLRPHLGTARRWLPQVIAGLSALKLPVSSALPLLAEASAKGAVQPQTVMSFIRTLKAEGKWTDAFALWLSQQPKGAPLLYNAGFDQRFIPDGFDWEVTPVLPSRAGAIAAQRGLGKRGQVVEVQFTGRAIAMPVLRQHLFIPPGKYLFRGEYMGLKFRSEQGLAWTVRCANNIAAAPAGHSEPLQDTAGAWKTFQFAFVIPPDCGPVASLQLETAAAFEARTGLRGQASFDSFELKPHGL